MVELGDTFVGGVVAPENAHDDQRILGRIHVENYAVSGVFGFEATPIEIGISDVFNIMVEMQWLGFASGSICDSLHCFDNFLAG